MSGPAAIPRPGRRIISAVLAAATITGGAITPTLSGAATDPVPGSVTDFGVQQTALTLFEAAYGADADGRPVAYGVQMGTPGVLTVVDLETRELVDTEQLLDTGGAWGVTQASDGMVYAGSYPNAHLYAYDPATGSTTDIGAPVPGESYLYGFRSGTDGRIYGGTYPHGHAFSYSPDEGFRDFGEMFPGEQYVPDVAIDPERNVLWAAVGTHGHLIRLDIATGEKRDIWPEELRGDANYPYDINLVGGKLFVKRVQTQAMVLDPDSGAVLADGFTMNSRGTSPVAPDGQSVYFTSQGQLWRYELTTDTYGPAPDTNGDPLAVGNAGVGWGFIDGRLYASIGNYSGGAMWYDPATGASEAYRLPFPPQPIDINSISPGPDGRIFTNLYLNGNLAVFDPATEQPANVGRVGQADGIYWHDEKMYLGIYPYGGVLEYDPGKPFAAGTNPRELFRMQQSHGQVRPVAFASSGTKIYVGSTPDYGLWGGALTVYDTATGERTTHRDIVADQAVFSVAVADGKLWAGTSIGGGGGTVPKAKEAKLFTADLETGEKIAEYTPVPDARAITAVVIGPDGNLWGMADGELFVVDPATSEVLHRRDLPGAAAAFQDELVVSTVDEHVYATLDGYLLKIDPLSLDVTVVRDAETYRLAQDPAGNMWFRNGVKQTNGSVLNGSHLLRYVPEADACLDSDLREHVMVGDVDSAVSNRYADEGCTLNDLIRDDAEWDSHAAFVTDVASVTRGLVRDEVITDAEKDAIVSAAASSDVGRE